MNSLIVAAVVFAMNAIEVVEVKPEAVKAQSCCCCKKVEVKVEPKPCCKVRVRKVRCPKVKVKRCCCEAAKTTLPTPIPTPVPQK